MGLSELTLHNFRLFDELHLTPDPSAVTVLLSPNGTGKTSVLEAIHFLATASSFRTTSASDAIRNNFDQSEVHGVVFVGPRRVTVDLTLTRSRRGASKKMLVNGQRPTSRADLAEALPLTVFTPEGVDVVRLGPDARRDLLNLQLTDLHPTSADLLERFARVLTQRNAFLRSLEGEWPSATKRTELAVWDSDFVSLSLELVRARETLLSELQPIVEELYQSLALEPVGVSMNYETSWDDDLTTALHDALRHDVSRGYTTVGPHRDDIILSIEGRDARRQASQGEQRSLALAWRLAAHRLVTQQRNVEPLLLLDDVFSELDPLRSQRLLSLLPAGQTLVSTASPLPVGMAPALVVDLTSGRSS